MVYIPSVCIRQFGAGFGLNERVWSIFPQSVRQFGARFILNERMWSIFPQSVYGSLGPSLD